MPHLTATLTAVAANHGATIAPLSTSREVGSLYVLVAEVNGVTRSLVSAHGHDHFEDGYYATAGDVTATDSHMPTKAWPLTQDLLFEGDDADLLWDLVDTFNNAALAAEHQAILDLI